MKWRLPVILSLGVLLGCGPSPSKDNDAPGTVQVAAPAQAGEGPAAAPPSPSPQSPTLGEWEATHPADSLLIASPGLDSRVGVGEIARDIWLGWCARSSTVLATIHGRTYRRHAYFYPVASENNSTDLKQVCRLGALGVDVNRPDGQPEFEYRVLDSIAAVELGGQEGQRVRSDNWLDAPTTCFDAFVPFYSQNATGAECAGTYRLEPWMGPSPRDTSPAEIAHGNPEDGIDQVRRLVRLDAGPITHILDSIVEVAPVPIDDTVPPDLGYLGRLLEFKRYVSRRPAAERPGGWLLLERYIAAGLAQGRLGRSLAPDWRPSELFDSLGVHVWFWESDAAWRYDRAWTDSAVAFAPVGEVGDSLFSWVLAGAGPCKEYGGTRVRTLLNEVRPFTVEAHSPATRSAAWYEIAQLWADSAAIDPSPFRAGLRDSSRTALTRGLALDPGGRGAPLARRALWRGQLGLVPLLGRSTCEYAD